MTKVTRSGWNRVTRPRTFPCELIPLACAHSASLPLGRVFTGVEYLRARSGLSGPTDSDTALGHERIKYVGSSSHRGGCGRQSIQNTAPPLRSEAGAGFQPSQRPLNCKLIAPHTLLQTFVSSLLRAKRFMRTEVTPRLAHVNGRQSRVTN